MPSFKMNLDLNMQQNQILQPVLQVLTATPSSPAPVAGQPWYRSNISNGAGNGVIVYRDSSGNDITLSTTSNAFATITDGTTPATAAGADTFKLRTTGTGLTVATQNNDATHGDNALFTLDSTSTGGNNKVLITNGSGKTSMASVFFLGSSLGTVEGEVGYSTAQHSITWYNGTTQVYGVDTGSTQSITGQKTFSSFVLSGSGPAVAGALGYNGGFLQMYNGTGQETLATGANVLTLTNKTLTNPVIGGTGATAGGALNYSAGILSVGNGTTAENIATVSNTMTFTGKSFGADVSHGGFKITNLADGVSTTDAATVGQMQSMTFGMAWKDDARALSSTNITIATPGSSIGGVTPALTTPRERYVLTGQTTASENGIYDWNGAATPMTRSSDADTAAEIRGAVVPITEGTFADQLWQLTTDSITLGTTSLSWRQLPGPQDIVGGAGIVKTGNTLDVVANANGTIVVAADDVSVSTGLASAHTVISGGTAGVLARTATNTVTARSVAGTTNRITLTNGDFSAGNATVDIAATYVGQTSITTLGTIATGTWNGTVIGLLYGGVGVDASTGAGAATARDTTHLGRPATAPANATNVVASAAGLYTAAKFTITGTGAATAFTLTHNLNNTSPIIGPLINGTSKEVEMASVVATDANTVTVTFNTAPANLQTYLISIVG